jgi:signal transduction histidine kinase
VQTVVTTPTSPRSLAPLLLRTIGGAPVPDERDAQTQTTVLLVEDNRADARLIQLQLPADEFTVVHVERLADATLRLEAGDVDIVLLDLSLPDGEGGETIAWTLAAAPNTPVVVLTGLANDQVAVQAVRAGVQDYLVKDQLQGDLLPRTIRHAIERERLTNELDALRRHQLESKDQLLSHVSHELRTPLNAVYQFVMLLIDEIGGPLTDDQRDYLGIARRNIGQLGAMIDDLLDATRLQGGTLAIAPAATALDAAVDETCLALATEARGKGVALEVALDPALPLLRADPLRLRQVLANLVQNAVKFTPASGTVTVTARVDAAEPGIVKVAVADTGGGIAPEALPHVFERFRQGNASSVESRKGLGLGLYICRELVQRQGGRIWVERTSNRGTTMAFTVPTAAPSARLDA